MSSFFPLTELVCLFPIPQTLMLRAWQSLALAKTAGCNHVAKVTPARRGPIYLPRTVVIFPCCLKTHDRCGYSHTLPQTLPLRGWLTCHESQCMAAVSSKLQSWGKMWQSKHMLLGSEESIASSFGVKPSSTGICSLLAYVPFTNLRVGGRAEAKESDKRAVSASEISVSPTTVFSLSVL